jgi:hypothetical protein
VKEEEALNQQDRSPRGAGAQLIDRPKHDRLERCPVDAARTVCVMSLCTQSVGNSALGPWK